MNWFLLALKKYAVFTGRSRRSEYWYFVLFYFLICIVLAIVDTMTGTMSAQYGMGVLGSLFALAMVIPSIAVGVRRLHDIGKSGWWLLVGFIPLVGLIVLIVWACRDSQPGTNAYGPNPKESGAAPA
ncbi:MAG TPA: DUF805 domain-containing protein [Steroidobacteraceae bacterium]|jgi:uncharacterized membrane protein YhaH (DUF805 family)|nr:DUF805 domain-containing protein [Steroidobacteraceae bacterium]